MSRPGPQVDSLEPLTRTRPKRWWDGASGPPASDEGFGPIPVKRTVAAQPIVSDDPPIANPVEVPAQIQRNVADNAPNTEPSHGKPEPDERPVVTESWLVRRGHAVTYVGIFLFTFVLYFRPYELLPGLEAFSSMALVLAAATLAIYFPSQFALEGNLTAMPVEIKLVIGLTVAALISIPIGISPGHSWETFNNVFIKAVLMFIVIVNVVRSESRLTWLIWLAIAVGIMLSINAMRDYNLGKFANDGYRVDGTGRGLFGNPNDMALFLVIITPIALSLLFATRSYAMKVVYGVCVLLFLAGNTITFSRAGFLGLVTAMVVLLWKVGYGRRLQVAVFAIILAAAFLIVAPGNYGLRVASIFIPQLDPVGSSGVREGHLIQSIWVTLRNPIAGIGMGNFGLVSNHAQVTHNSYTQVSSELGVAALVVYLGFILFPLWQLFKIEGEARGDREAKKYLYLAIGLQAGIAGFMVSSFFASVAFQWYIYYLIGYAVCLRRIFSTRPALTSEPASATNVETTPSLLARIPGSAT